MPVDVRPTAKSVKFPDLGARLLSALPLPQRKPVDRNGYPWEGVFADERSDYARLRDKHWFGMCVRDVHRDLSCVGP